MKDGAIMPIDDIKPSEAVKPYMGNKADPKKRSFGKGGGQGHYGGSASASVQGGGEAVDDVTSFMNIPQEELTPAVSDAIISLMEEIDHLREELNLTHSFEDRLSHSLDRHMDLPVLTRHALVRELAIMAAHVGKTQTHSSFAYFQIANFAALKKQYGLLAGEAVIRETSQILKANLRETDRIGTLGGDGFGVVLALSDVAHSQQKLENLKVKVEQGPMFYDGYVLAVHVAYGVCAIHADQDVKEILKQADVDLKGRLLTQ